MAAWLNKGLDFLAKAFSEDGSPSSSRIISAWLSISSMALIWWMAKHMMSQPVEKLQVWIGGLPLIIGALATFAVSPYGVAKITGIFNKVGSKIEEHERDEHDTDSGSDVQGSK